MYRRIEVPGRSAMLLASKAMVGSGLPDPEKLFLRPTNKTLHFFFTEYGWEKCGHAILSELRSKGHRARVISVGEKAAQSSIRYRDKWQVALLFCWPKGKSR